MALHDLELVLAERARLAEDAVVDADLADVVQQRADAQVAHLLLGEAEVLADGDRVAGHALGVAARVRILRVDGRGEHAHGVDEEQVVLVRRLLELLDGLLDRRGHDVEVRGQLADLVVRLQLDALLVVALRDLVRALARARGSAARCRTRRGPPR